MVSCHDASCADSPEIEGIEGNRPLKIGEIRRNLVKFFAYVIAGSIWFRRVVLLVIGSIQKGGRPMISNSAYFGYF